jgi:glyoxylase-like metal-dependent hydrolase (beta-lactamase superfamily II)
VIIGDRFVMVSDCTATPSMARDLIKRIREVSDKPIKYVLLTHYHAVRVLGASAFVAEGASEVIASQGTYELIVERGKEDMQSEMDRFPRLFRNAESVPGLTWPTLVIGGGDPARGEVPGKLTLDLGGVRVQVWSPGWGHTRGDTIAWVEEEKVLFSGDLVEYNAGVYTGDAHLQEWPAALEALRALKAEALVPGRGEAMKGNAQVNKALDYTKQWVETLFRCAKEAAAANMDLKATMAHVRKAMDPIFGHVFIYEHCLPFDVSRAYDEARGIKNPRVWTAERDKEMWASLQD